MPVSVIENASFGNSGIVTANGIKFPATQVASADANTLDDYEEGTWTTTFDPSPVNMSGTPTLSQAVYTKVGRLVTIAGLITGYSITNTNTATYPVLNLPFAMTGNSAVVTGSVIMLRASTWSVGSALDNSSGEAVSTALIFPAATITASGSVSIWFSITYSAA
jgi:hypothetical protein